MSNYVLNVPTIILKAKMASSTVVMADILLSLLVAGRVGSIIWKTAKLNSAEQAAGSY